MIELRNFSLYSPLQKKPLLDTINLILTKGSRVALSGPSGAGKSALAYCLTGIQHDLINASEKGEIIRSPASCSVGMVLQNPEVQLFAETVAGELDAQGRSREEIYSLGLGPLRDKKISELSLGQKQRLACAAQMLRQPDLLIIDEPTNNLDHAGLSYLADALALYPGAILIIEHNLTFLWRHCRQFVILEQGKVIFNGDRHSWLQSRHRPRQVDIALKLAKKSSPPVPASSDYAAWEAWRPNLAEKPKPVASDHFATHRYKPLVSIEQASFGYRDACLEIRDVHIHRGEIVALLGTSGAGKTTMLRALMGLARRFAGDIDYPTLNRRNARPEQLFPHLGLALQNPDAQLCAATVAAECGLAINHHHQDRAHIEAAVRKTLLQFQLGHLSHRTPFSISYGEKRRLTLASITIAGPHLLLLDEPTIALDAAQVARLETFLLEQREQRQMAVLFSTHDLDFACSLADRYIFLADGRIGGQYDRRQMQVEILRNHNLRLPLAALWGQSLTPGQSCIGSRDLEAMALHG
jgi:energy-coupling factor transporter ATP-binding protein EcfA2